MTVAASLTLFRQETRPAGDTLYDDAPIILPTGADSFEIHERGR